MTAYRLAWTTPAGELLAIEPDDGEVTAHAPALAAAYNDPHNARLLGHGSLLTASDVQEHYTMLREAGAHGFLLMRDGVLAGDGDLRAIADGAAEFAFLIASPGAQGKGLGTRFALMIHAFAFRSLMLDRLYAAVVPDNLASRRVFEKLGYVVDDGPRARSFGDAGDVVLRLDRASFLRDRAPMLDEIRIAARQMPR
ncbi:MAG: GNAT family N-acetyltransferase [Deltaproteobacteria bacterium]|nr:GNAT family N-acetyltransferase [Deltaproteobacteria bacterium]MDQ3296839.1 GNAT family N-acetyltransferase [Myxococcota bacterium]